MSQSPREQKPSGSAYRPATAEDARAIQGLIGEVYAEYGVYLLLDSVDAHLNEPAGYFRKSGGCFWVLERTGAIVGTVGARPNADDSAELKSLYIHRSMRRQGWGRRLIELVMDYARARGKRRLVLWSDTRFLDAHRLYSSMGFVQEGVRELNDVFDTQEYGFTRCLEGE